MNKITIRFAISLIIGFVMTIAGLASGKGFLGCVGILWMAISFAIYNVDSQTRNASYDKKTKTLNLHARNSYSEGFIRIERYKHENLKYNPEKLVYTGASVGGVSMGGFHVEKAHYSVESKQKTDYYELYFYTPTDKNACGVIEKIVCDFDVGNSKFIQKYKINKNTLIPKNTNKKAKYTQAEKEAIKLAKEQNNLAALQGFSLKNTTASMLTLNEAEKLKKWIGGKDYK